MLTHFKVSNYKCLVDVELPLTPIHVIIGQNDSGKTSLLEAIWALARSAEGYLPLAFAGDWRGRELVHSAASPPIVKLAATYESQPQGHKVQYELDILFQTPDKDCYVNREWLLESETGQILTQNSNQSRVSRRRDPGLPLMPQLDSLAELMAPASYYRLDPKAMALPAATAVDRKYRLAIDGFGIPTLLDDILGDDADRFISLRREFCEYFPQFRKVGIETLDAYHRQFDKDGVLVSSSMSQGKGVFFETIDGAKIKAQQASDGAIIFLGLLALMYSPNPPKMLLIEEPEKGIYPLRLEELVGLIRRLHGARPAGAMPQIIMTTHSPYLLSFFQPDEVTFLSRRDKTGPVRACPLRDAPHIQERLGGGAFYLGELWYNLSEEDLFGDA
jgi:predicted ATPase